MNRNNLFYKTILYKWSKINMPLLLTVCALLLYGLLVLFSISDCSISPWVSKQLFNISLCIPFIIFFIFVDINILYKISYIFYLLIILILIIVMLIGYTAKGGTRWINLGGFKMQPSELSKLAVILALSRYFHATSFDKINKLFYIFLPLSFVMIAALLIIKQPDLGTGIIFLIISGSMFFAVGISIKKFIFLGISIIGSMPILWNLLHEYQKTRVKVFLNPELDPLGTGYNILQSKIAIGSGGFLGKGLCSGTQGKLRFLPEHQTDFIFAAMSEDFGMLGAIILVSLYLIIIYISIMIANSARSSFGKLLVVGVISMFFSHIFINIGMVIGLLPVVGVPLPLVSYGGTMTATMLSGFAIIMNVYINRNKNIK
jgi:rod shape determining protein RodA